MRFYSITLLNMRVPIWVSNRHIHLTQADANTLFWWPNYELTKIKDLSQPWQFASEECVIIKWPKSEIAKVRVLWPYRKQTQVEVMKWDTIKLGTDAPIRESWDLKWSAPITVIWPKGQIELKEGMIVAKRHIHMTVADAQNFWVENGQIVKVRTNGERSLVFDEVVIRVSDSFALDMHIDIEEANAAALKQWDRWELILD